MQSIFFCGQISKNHLDCEIKAQRTVECFGQLQTFSGTEKSFGTFLDNFAAEKLAVRGHFRAKWSTDSTDRQMHIFVGYNVKRRIDGAMLVILTKYHNLHLKADARLFVLTGLVWSGVSKAQQRMNGFGIR